MTLQSIAHYDLLERLGSGGMGEVFRAYDTRLERPVAIKRIRPDKDDPEASDKVRRRFRREAKAIAKINHPAVVQIFDLLFLEDVDWIVMEYVEGRSLRKCSSPQPLPPHVVIRLGRQIASGLAEVHSKGIIHRDLKTDNVLVTVRGNAKIVDFGVVKEMFSDTLTLTLSQRLVGTVRAMSPEQARGADVDARSDLFSLGTLLYESLCSQSPFQDVSPAVTLSRIAHFEPPPVVEVNPEVPQKLSYLIEKLLRKDPAQRPQTALEVERLLAQLDEAPEQAATVVIKKIFATNEDEETVDFSDDSVGSFAALEESALSGRWRRWRLAWLGLVAVLALVLGWILI